MKARAFVFSSATALGFLLSGCGSPGKSSASPTSATRSGAPDAFARQNARQDYVDSHYERLLQSGQFKNEAEARAYAGYEWSRLHPNPAASEQNQSVTWSSADAAKHEQEKFEADLAKMNRK